MSPSGGRCADSTKDTRRARGAAARL